MMAVSVARPPPPPHAQLSSFLLTPPLSCTLCTVTAVERALRLRGGRTALEGQLEVYLDGGWGVIHDEDWTLDDATVACRQMGFAGAADALQTGYAGVWPPSARVVLDSVACTGKEISLLACSYSNVSRLLGNGEMIASVVCAGKVIVVLNMYMR